MPLIWGDTGKSYCDIGFGNFVGETNKLLDKAIRHKDQTY